jgi:PhnB protein
VPIPAGYHAVIPYLAIRGAAQAIDFYKKAVSREELMRIDGPEGKLGHCEIQIGDSRVMLADEYESMQFLGPQSRGGTTVQIHLYVPDVDATVARAAAAGGKVVRPVEDQFYGDRAGAIEDPFGPPLAYRDAHRGRLDGGSEAACREARQARGILECLGTPPGASFRHRDDGHRARGARGHRPLQTARYRAPTAAGLTRSLRSCAARRRNGPTS